MRLTGSSSTISKTESISVLAGTGVASAAPGAVPGAAAMGWVGPVCEAAMVVLVGETFRAGTCGEVSDIHRVPNDRGVITTGEFRRVGGAGAAFASCQSRTAG